MKPLPAKLCIEKGYCVTPNLHKKCVYSQIIFVSVSQSKHIVRKGKMANTKRASFMQGGHGKLTMPSESSFLCLLPPFVDTLPILLVSISPRLYLFLHNIYTFSHLPTSLYTPFQFSHKLYPYLCIGQLFMEGCKLKEKKIFESGWSDGKAKQ